MFDVECLIRTAHAGRMLGAEFVRRQIPYRFIGGMSLLQSSYIKDLLCLLRVSLNHRDELGCVRYLTLYPRIGEQTGVETVKRIVPLATGEEAELALDLLYLGHDLSKTFADVREEREPVLAVRTGDRRLDEILNRRYDNWDRRKGDFGILEKLAARYETNAGLLEALTLDPVTNTEADE